MKTMRVLMFVSLLFVASIGHSANVVLLQQTTVDTNGLTFDSGNFSLNINGRTFQQQNAVSTFNGYQYTTYYDANRNVCVGRRQLPAGTWEIIRLTDYVMLGNDAHDVTTLGICSADGTIHLAFDHHGGSLNYRVSSQGVITAPESVVWDASLFGPVTNVLGSVGSISSVTYPRFFNAPNGNLMLYYRRGGSGNGDGMLQEYNGTTHDWTTGLGEFIARTGTYNGVLSTNSTSRNPYLNGIFYTGNRLHVSWNWRESAGGSQNNHDLCYAYSDDDGRTWRNNAGTVIGTTGTSSITLDSPGVTVVPIAQNENLINQMTQYAYPDGSVHVMLRHYLSGTSTTGYHHYWRNAAGVWTNAPLTFSGNRPKIVGDSDGNLFMAYTSGGTLRIAKGVPDVGITDWTWSSAYTQSGTPAGGEALVDTRRWETERVLSVYDQEKPPIDGDPSPLHIWDYQVSAKAILPNPVDYATNVPVGTNLTWTAGLNAVAHDVYLGTNEAAVASATTISPEFKGQQAGNAYPPTSLDGTTTYFWRIDEVQADLSVVPGQVWQFTTTTVPNPDTVAHAGGDQSVPDAGADGIELITLDGSASTPGDGLSITNYVWKRGSQQIATGITTNVTLQLGTHIVTLEVTDSGGATKSDTATITVTRTGGASTNLLAGWDTWVGFPDTNAVTSITNVPAPVIASGVSAGCVADANPTNGAPWRVHDGRGASGDGDWGAFAGPPTASTASGAESVHFECMELGNAQTDGTLTFSITNNGASDYTLDAFHFDSYAFRPKAARTYELSVVAGSDITPGVIYTSGALEITHVGGVWDNLAHDDIDHSLTNLADHTLGAGESVDFLLAFSDGVGDGSGGHDLWVDNVGITYLSAGAYPDADGNGLPDWWEIYYLGSTGQVASVDSDLDGLSNGDELVAGTDPGDINSALVVNDFEEEAGEGYTVKWDSYSDRTYDVLKASVLGSNVWASISGPLPGTGGEMLFTDPASPSNTFYKIQVTQP